eukprot:s1184_g14.t1
MTGSSLVDTPGPKILKDEGLVYTILMCLSLSEVRKLWHLRRTFFKVLKDKVVPLLALAERDWSIVRVFLDSGAFQYNLDSVFTEAVLESDFKGLRLLAERSYSFAAFRHQARNSRDVQRLTAFVRKALKKGHVDKLSLLRSLHYDLQQDLQESAAITGGIAEQLQSEGSITVDFLGSRNTFRFGMLELATSNYAEQKIQDLCKLRIFLYKVPFVLSSFLKAGAATNSFMQVESCGYLLLLALAAESFNFVYLLIQEAVNVQQVLESYSSELLLMVSKAMGARPGVLDLLHFCGYQLPEEQQQFDAEVLASVRSQDFATVERMSKLGFSLRDFAGRQQVELSPLLQKGLQDLCESAVVSEEEGPDAGKDSGEGATKSSTSAIRRLAQIDRRMLELHFQSREFLEFAHALMSSKDFIKMRQLVEVHPYTFRPYFEKNYKAMEELLLDAFCRRQIALIVDLTSLRLPIAPFLQSHQEQLDIVLRQSWFASKAWTELVMLRLEVKDFDFGAFFQRTCEQIDFAVMGIIQDGYWFDLHKLAQLDFDFDKFFDRRFAEVSKAVMQFMTMPHPHFVLLRELSALRFPWDRFMEEHGNCVLSSKVAGKEILSSGVHCWEVEVTSGATANNNRDIYIGVAVPGCDVEKGEHHEKGKAWYLRTHDGNIYGSNLENEDVAKKGKLFVAGDRVGLRLDCNDGSLRFYRNGEPFGDQFPPGSITSPVVRAVELKCQGQSVTLLPDGKLPQSMALLPEVQGA